MSSDRAVAPAVGILVLVAVIVVAASALAAVAADADPGAAPPIVAFGASADASGEIAITHRGGSSLDPDALAVRISVDGDPLDRHPPVPFFAARGLGSGPTGAFNSATAGSWRAGETASFRIAETNEPTPSSGSTVRIRLYARGKKIADLTATVR